MLAVNVGDVVLSTHHPGEWTVRNAQTYRDDDTRLFYMVTPGGPADDDKIQFAFEAVSVYRNLTTGEGCEKSKPSCKFYHRERWQGYEREFGAETLPELYALMAAAGMKFSPVMMSPKPSMLDWEELSAFVSKGAATTNEVRTHRDETDPDQPTVVGG